MSENDEHILKLAISIVDREAVDWERAAKFASNEEERALIRQLGLLARVAEMSEELSQVAEDEPTPQATDLKSNVSEDADVSQLPGIEAAAPPSKWGHLEIRERIASGAFGTVYRAWETTLQREVALKLFELDKIDSSRKVTELTDKILKEGRLLARVRHPNVVTVHGVECHDGTVGLWMELIRGRTLDELLREQGSFGASEAASIGLELCRALAAVHGANLLHRDLNARNVMREEGGRILLMDFGASVENRVASEVFENTVGTLCYMAPEVLRGQGASRQSDIYSLGVLLYRLVANAYPVQGVSRQELLMRHERNEVQLSRDARPDLPAAFVQVVEKALAPDPSSRFATAGEMERALAAAAGLTTSKREQRTSKAPRSRRTLWMIAAAVALLAIAGGFALLQWDSPRFASSDSERAMTDPASATLPSSAAAAAVAPFRVEATFHRRLPDGLQQPLMQGSRIQVGDGLFLEFEASAETHVYVINEDERGRAYLLFPLPQFANVNPLSANTPHVLPGLRGDRNFVWEVTSTGEREHLLIVASCERLSEFEALARSLPRSRVGANSEYAELTQAAQKRLRGIGGLKEIPTDSGNQARRLFELAAKLKSEPESASGVWVRHIELENQEP